MSRAAEKQEKHGETKARQARKLRCIHFIDLEVAEERYKGTTRIFQEDDFCHVILPSELRIAVFKCNVAPLATISLQRGKRHCFFHILLLSASRSMENASVVQSFLASFSLAFPIFFARHCVFHALAS